MTRAAQLSQYVTELEEYVAEHGHLPAASRCTPATNKQRLKYALESRHTDEGLKRRIRTLLETPTYTGLRNDEAASRARAPKIPSVLQYLELLEGYVDEHGHLPSTHSGSTPWTDKQRLKRYLKHPGIDSAVKRRVEGLLAQPMAGRAKEGATPEQFDALPRAVAALAKPPSASQLEALDWIIANRKVPAFGDGEGQERNAYRVLATARRSAVRGSATLRTAEFVLLIPGLLTPAEREKASAHVAVKRSQAEERESRRNRLGSLEDRWDKGFEELSAWVEAHRALPRRRTFDAEEYRVANWLNVQRMQLRDNNLRPGWKERLATIPGALEPLKQLRGEAELAKTVADFYERHGRLPRSDVPAPEGTVGMRLQRLRTRIRNGDIGRDALQILASLPGATEFVDRKPPLERLADLEDFVRTTGTFPALNTGGLSNWAYRALNGRGSKRAPEAIRLRAAVAELRDSVPYKVHREKPALVEYVSCLEQHVAAHGHLPSSSKGAVPRLRPDRLEGALASETTDDVLRERIRKVLASPPCPHRRWAAA